MLELDTARNRQLGIAMVSVTTLCFAALDSSAKWLVMVLPVFQVVWLRFVTHSLLGILVLTPKYGWALPHWPAAAATAAGTDAGSNDCADFWALQYLQLDVTGAIQFSVPILIAVISARLLGERLDARRWIAILVGFAGVLLIVRPGSQGFHPAIILSLINAVLYALLNMLTRRLAATELPATTQLWSALGAAVLLTPFGLMHWTPPQDAITWILVLAMGALDSLGPPDGDAGASVCIGRCAGTVSVPADHLHDAVRLVAVRPRARCGRHWRGIGCRGQRVSAVSGVSALNLRPSGSSQAAGRSIAPGACVAAGAGA